VVSVILILMALVISVGDGVIESSRRRSTENTMRIMRTAMEAFRNDEPFRADSSYQAMFGSFPASNLNRLGVAGGDFPDAKAYGQQSGLPRDFASRADYDPLGTNSPPYVYAPFDFESIEAFCFYCRQYSPAARDVLAQLRDTLLTNQDKAPPDFVREDWQNRDPDWVDMNDDGSLGPEDVQLVEIVDAWGRPLRYHADRATNWNHDDDPDEPDDWYVVHQNDGFPVILSAGPDGKFGDCSPLADPEDRRLFEDNVVSVAH